MHVCMQMYIIKSVRGTLSDSCVPALSPRRSQKNVTSVDSDDVERGSSGRRVRHSASNSVPLARRSALELVR